MTTNDLLRAALERLRANAKLSLASKPVRDWDETFAEVDAALATPEPPPGTLKVCAHCGEPIARRRGDVHACTPEPSAGPPPEWKLVPMEPTQKMIDDGYLCLTYDIELRSDDLFVAYRAMLAACPPVPQDLFRGESIPSVGGGRGHRAEGGE